MIQQGDNVGLIMAIDVPSQAYQAVSMNLKLMSVTACRPIRIRTLCC